MKLTAQLMIKQAPDNHLTATDTAPAHSCHEITQKSFCCLA